MKKLSIVILTVFTIFLISCGSDDKKNNQNETVEVSHQKGSSRVPKEIKRVVCLDYSILETLDYLNIPVLGIPKDNVPYHLKKYGENTEIVDLGTLKEVNFEKINALRPDVILISNRLESSYDELNKIAPTVYLTVDPKDFTHSLKKAWDVIGMMFAKEQEVDKAFEDIQTKAAAVREKAKEKNLKGLITLFNKGKFSAYGRNSRYGIIHELLGVPTAVENIEDARHGQAISNEFIQKTNPDILFVIDRNAVIDKKSSDKQDIENTLVRQTNAYKNGRIVYLNPEIWYLAGNGIVSVNTMIDDISKALD